MTAAKNLALATYKYNDLDQQMKDVERRYVPKRVRERAAVLGVILKFGLEHQISWKWEF